MKNQISPTDRLLIKLETLIFTINLTNKQFSHYYPETPTEIENNTIKLEKANVITRFYTRDVDNNLLAYYKINYPIQTCYTKIKDYYG